MSHNAALEEDATALGIQGPLAGLRLKIWLPVQLLAMFLPCPESSRLCITAVVKTTEKLLPQDEDLKSCVRILRTEHHAFLDALVRFVAVPRPQDQLRLLEARLCECRCDLSLEVLQVVHDSVNYTEELTFRGLIASIFTTLAAVVQKGPKVGHLLGAQAASLGEHSTKKWPASAAALFPAGQEAAVISFAHLFRSTHSPAILNFIRLTFPHCPSLAKPISESILFWESMVEGLGCAVGQFREDPILTDIDSDPEETEERGPRSIIHAFTMFLSAFIATFTETLRQQLASSPLVTYARKIYDLLLKVLLLAKPSPNQGALAPLCLVAAGMASCLANVMPRRERPPRIHPVIRAYGHLSLGAKEWAFTEVFAAMGRIGSVAQCCNAVCTETSESSALKLRYCARCRLMRYCSSACQKAAWKYHKIVCADLLILNTKAMPKPDVTDEYGKTGQCLVDFEKEAKKLGFTVERMKEMSAELTPFCHFQNAGSTTAPSHEDVNHC